MGIKNYLKKLDQENTKDRDRIYNDVFIDCNYLIHYLIYGCTCDKDLYNKLFDFVKYLLNTISIKNNLFLIFDGNYDKKYNVNPKIATHLKRYKVLLTVDDLSEELEGIPYDKQPIMPKSNIINTFKNYLSDIFNKFKICYNQSFKIIFNEDTVDGEADIKIMNTIINDVVEKTNICIISKDTDMILISYNIIIKFAQNNCCYNIDVLCNLRPIKFVNVNKLVQDFNDISIDYIIILFFMGNDFLPPISNIDYECLINTYRKLKSHYKNTKIIYKDQLNYDTLLLLLTYFIINKNIKYKFKNINLTRFQKYINNFKWCLHYYNITENYYKDTCYEIDSSTSVINVFNFIS